MTDNNANAATSDDTGAANNTADAFQIEKFDSNEALEAWALEQRDIPAKQLRKLRRRGEALTKKLSKSLVKEGLPGKNVDWNMDHVGGYYIGLWHLDGDHFLAHHIDADDRQHSILFSYNWGDGLPWVAVSGAAMHKVGLENRNGATDELLAAIHIHFYFDVGPHAVYPD